MSTVATMYIGTATIRRPITAINNIRKFWVSTPEPNWKPKTVIITGIAAAPKILTGSRITTGKLIPKYLTKRAKPNAYIVGSRNTEINGRSPTWSLLAATNIPTEKPTIAWTTKISIPTSIPGSPKAKSKTGSPMLPAFGNAVDSINALVDFLSYRNNFETTKPIMSISTVANKIDPVTRAEPDKDACWSNILEKLVPSRIRVRGDNCSRRNRGPKQVPRWPPRYCLARYHDA